jgi:uncharacterized protein YydD (DUF2326 family)
VKYYHQAAKTVMSKITRMGSWKVCGRYITRAVKLPKKSIIKQCKDGFTKVFREWNGVLEESIYKNNEYNGLAILKIRKVM